MDSNTIKTLLECGAGLANPSYAGQPTPGDGAPFTAIPNEFKIAELERLLPAPHRKRGAVVVNDAPSFIAYTKKHGSLDECVIYADIDTTKNHCHMVAVINDHKSDGAQWRDNTCTFVPKLSVEWDRWVEKNHSTMNQSDFAAWIEDNLPDIVSAPGMPTGAEMLEMALCFEATSDKRLRSKTNLQSGGVQFEFVDDEDKDTRTRMKVFERFTIGIPVFEGSTSAYPIECRLKYREKDGKVMFWFEMIRPDRVFKAAVSDELKQINEATGFLLLNGKP